MSKLFIRACLWLFAGLFPGASPVAIAQESAGDEPLVKAAFIYNFAKFTRWPESALGEPGTPLSLCIAGTDELVPALEQLSGKTVKGHPVDLQALNSGLQVPRTCDILYVATSEQKRHIELVKSIRSQPILTVSELPRFAHAGGIIEFTRESGRIRFIINLDAARAAGLEIHPNLLRLGIKPPEQAPSRP